MLPQMTSKIPEFYGWVDLVVCGLVGSLTIEHAAPDPWFGPGKDPQVDHGILTEAELWLWLWPGKEFYRRKTLPTPQQFARKVIIGDWTFPCLKGPDHRYNLKFSSMHAIRWPFFWRPSVHAVATPASRGVPNRNTKPMNLIKQGFVQAQHGNPGVELNFYCSDCLILHLALVGIHLWSSMLSIVVVARPWTQWTQVDP